MSRHLLLTIAAGLVALAVCVLLAGHELTKCRQKLEMLNLRGLDTSDDIWEHNFPGVINPHPDRTEPPRIICSDGDISTSFEIDVIYPGESIELPVDVLPGLRSRPTDEYAPLPEPPPQISESSW